MGSNRGITRGGTVSRSRGSAIKSLARLGPQASFAKKAELAVYGDLLRLTECEYWILVISNPKDYSPEEVEDCERLFGEYAARIIREGGLDALAKAKTVADEWKKRALLSVALTPSQESALDQLFSLTEEGCVLKPMVRRTMLQVLRMSCTAEHKVYAGVLFFSRRVKSSLQVGLEAFLIQNFFPAAIPAFPVDAAALGSWHLSGMLDALKLGRTSWIFDEFAKCTIQERLTASALKARIAGLLGKEYPTQEIRRAAKLLGVPIRSERKPKVCRKLQ